MAVSRDGVGESLALELSGNMRVAELRPVPGYAKADTADGTDRYAENRRIVLEIVSSSDADHRTVAVSDVRIAAAAQ
ncbi:MAG: hypothetical protein ICV70_08240 [Jiangellaceae bacterium]|nr:hypothetical protein [Jiangellaceae bacterium]